MVSCRFVSVAGPIYSRCRRRHCSATETSGFVRGSILKIDHFLWFCFFFSIINGCHCFGIGFGILSVGVSVSSVRSLVCAGTLSGRRHLNVLLPI